MALTKIPANLLDTSSHVDFANNEKLRFGTGSDLQIYSDGTHSRIYESGSGLLIIRAGGFNINNADGSQSYITMSDGGATTLYHAGAAKLATASGGASVTGNLAVSGNLTVSGTTTELDTTNLNVTDKNITLNYHASNDTSSNANGAGITIQDAVDASNDATLTWNTSLDKFDLSHGLHIGDSAAIGDATTPALQIGGTTTYRMGLYTSAEGAVIENKNGDDGIQFRVKTAGEAMRIDGGTGNVGIGTDNPGAPLAIISNTAGHPSNYATVWAKNTDTTGAAFAGYVADGHLQSHYRYYIQGALKWQTRVGAGNGADDFRIYSWTKGDDVLTILNSGKVGIGTTNPNLKLHVEESVADQWIADFKHTHANAYGLRIDLSGTTSSTRYAFGVYTGGGTGLFLRNNGNLGIGDNSPDNKLSIRAASTIGTKNGHIMLTGDSATNGQGPQIVFSESGGSSDYAGASVGYARTGSNSIGDLIFGTRGTSGDANTAPTERMRIDSAGTIFQGTTSPTLHSAVRGIVFENGSIINDVTRGAGKSMTLAQNAAVDSGNTWAYLATDEASYYQQFGGKHYFATAPSGSAGADITFDNKMIIDNDYVVPKMNFHYAENTIYAVNTTGDEHSSSNGVMMLKQQISVRAGSKIIVWYDTGQILNNNQGGNGSSASNPQIAIYVSSNASAPSRGAANQINGNTDHFLYPVGNIGSARIKMNGMGATGTISSAGTYYIYMYGGSYNSGQFTFNYQNSSAATGNRGSSIIWTEIMA